MNPVQQKELAERIINYLFEAGVLDRHFKANIQTKESWVKAIYRGIVVWDAERIERLKERFKELNKREKTN